MKTWKKEAIVVATVLLVQLCFTNWLWSEIICSLAVYYTFLHAQVSDRMQERQALLAKPDVECYKKSTYYFMAKEALWISFFIMTKSYAAIFGAILFFLYPLWRRYYRKIKPIQHEQS
jgi:hypothetical protein